MKKLNLFIAVFIITAGLVCAQRSTNSISQIDNTANALVREIHRKLVEERATKVTVSQQFLFGGSIPPFASYWANQLTGALANTSNKPYILLADGLADADFRILGEIVETADIIRVYTRLIRLDNRAIVASFQSDFERNAAITAMLASRGSAYVPLDDYEPDSWNNPVSFEIGADENSTTMARTIHENEEEDFFLLISNSNGRLVMETTGNTDTYMEFYDANTRRLLAEDDDSGQSNNAKIIYNIEAGKRYIAKVRGYGGETTGQYAFRAYFRIPRESDSSWENPVRYNLGVDQNATEVNRVLYEDVEDFFLLVPNSNGRLVMETTGDTDTYMEFYDADTKRLLAEDDDSGGQEYNAKISYNVERGKRYIAKVRGYGGETTGQYAFKAYILPPREGASSWENPVRYNLGANRNATVVNRVLYENDEDFFILVPNRNGSIVMETTGDTDTYMEFYDANTKQLLDEDDDSGGQEYNAQITYNVESGKRYIVKIRSYGGSPGSYGFRAYSRN